MGYSTLARLAEERCETLYAIAKGAKIDHKALYDWRRGRCKPKVDKLLAVARYLQVPLETFLDDEQESDD